MNKDNLTKLIQLNSHFYSQVQDEFSDSRNRPLRGWDKIASFIKNEFKREDFTICDLACGNGRLFTFLQDKYYGFKYTGYDSNKFLLAQAITRYPEAEFILKDLFKEEISGGYDVVASFGFTHHIPGKDHRREYLERLTHLLNPGGLLLLSFWAFNPNKAINSRHGYENILEDNDYILGWKRKPDTYRYCHYFDKNEISELDTLFLHKGLRLVDEFSEDLNLYRIWKKDIHPIDKIVGKEL